MLADKVDHIIGVDTHNHSHTIAVVSPAGAVIASRRVPATPVSDLDGDRFAVEQAPGSRVWATWGHRQPRGPGLPPTCSSRANGWSSSTAAARPARRNGATADDLDAVRAARERSAVTTWPSRAGALDREAIRVLLTTRHRAMRARNLRDQPPLKALVVNAPEPLREQLRTLTTDQLLPPLCSPARAPDQADRAWRHDHRPCAAPPSARSPSKGEADELQAELDTLVRRSAARLLAEPGVGVICAAQLLAAWSHPGRLRSAAAFAMLGRGRPG